MRITRYKVSSKTEVTIKKNLFKSIDIIIPTRHLMYMVSDPERWHEIDKLEMNKSTLGELLDTIDRMITNRYEENVLCEILLKVAGKHHNPIENATIRQMIQNHERNI